MVGTLLGRSLQINKVFFWDFFCNLNHTLGGIELLVWEIFIMHDECINFRNPPTHHPKVVPYKHKTLHPLPFQYVWKILPDEGGGVQHTGDL